MINVWDTVFTFIHLPRMFLSTEIIFEYRLGPALYDIYILNLT